MFPCGSACKADELFTAFAGTAAGHRCQTAALQAAADSLAGYAAALGKQLCEITLPEMNTFTGQLYTAGSPAGRQHDPHQLVHMLNLFYTFLQNRGCVAVNPVEQLKQLAIAELLQNLAGHGCHTDDSREDTNETEA